MTDFSKMCGFGLQKLFKTLAFGDIYIPIHLFWGQETKGKFPQLFLSCRLYFLRECLAELVEKVVDESG